VLEVHEYEPSWYNEADGVSVFELVQPLQLKVGGEVVRDLCQYARDINAVDSVGVIIS
jgi:hypothetical protein